MEYKSTGNNQLHIGFKEAVYQGLASDGGLFVPQNIPTPEKGLFDSLLMMDNADLAYSLLHSFVKEDLTSQDLKRIIEQAFSFEIPLKKIGNSEIYTLELFHGPTWAFKDVGARFLAGCLSAWSQKAEEVTILVATSGDTGGAVANGFYRQPGTKVVVLYPSGKISSLQEMQIAGLGENIFAVRVDGTFDDCQRLVKMAFMDLELRTMISITSANSINLARWLPQMVFYGIAFKEILQKEIEPVLCVPSGNYGNITAGILMYQMGFRFQKMIASHNENDTIPRFLKNGTYHPYKTVQTFANAMDVSDPSNFVRLQYLWDSDKINSSEIFSAESVSDDQILHAIRDCWDKHNYLLDPHTATAWHVLNQNGAKGIIFSTAHPYKFEDIINDALGFYPEEWRKAQTSTSNRSVRIPVDYQTLKAFLLEEPPYSRK